MTADEVVRLRGKAGWSQAALSRALALVTAPPMLAEYRDFLGGALLAVGVLQLLSGVICFFASNWKDLGSMARFGLVELGILAGFTLALRRDSDSPVGRWALLFSGGLVGVLLAVYGQTYQTGADSYALFLTWAALTLPWALAIDFPPLRAGWWVVLNLAVGLAGDQLFDYDVSVLALSSLNGLAWAVARAPWQRNMTSTFCLTAATLAFCGETLDGKLGPAVFWGPLPVVVGLVAYGRGRSHGKGGKTPLMLPPGHGDQYMHGKGGKPPLMLPPGHGDQYTYVLCACLAAALCELNSWLLRPVLRHGGVLGFLGLGLFLVLQLGLAAAWMRTVRHSGEDPPLGRETP